jgi:uncharacterized protein (DUF885 family)
MTRSLQFLTAFLLIGITTMAKQTPKSNQQTSSRDNPRFSRLAEQFMHASLALSPVNASQAGYHQHRDPKSGKTIQLDAELDDLSPQAFARQAEFYRDWRERFRREVPVKSLSLEDQADWRLVDDQIAYNLLELEHIQSYKHQPTIYVELIGNALFLPMTQQYAAKEVRLGHVLSRVGQIPRALEQTRQELTDADAIFINAAVDENDGNVDLIENMLRKEIPDGSPLLAEYQKVAPAALQALRNFSQWLKDDLSKRSTASAGTTDSYQGAALAAPNEAAHPTGFSPRESRSSTTWRLGKDFYQQKFRYIMEVDVTPEQVFNDAQRELGEVRAEMLQLSLPMHKEMYPDHPDHSDLAGRERENKIIGEVLDKISQEHARRDELIDTVKRDVAGISQFIREKKLVSLSTRENLKVIPTPGFMRGVYSVAGFHSPPPLDPQSEAQYWVTPIDASVPEARAESKLREYNRWALQWLTIHEALPGHYIQFEHANSVQPVTRRLLRALFSNGPYVEGWAEYIAQVMMDEGFADRDPRFRLVMRKLRLRLLANTILDYRMHTMNMTDNEAMDLMTKDAFQTQAEAEGKLRRAKLTSVQLPTYYVGLRQWLTLRKKYQERMGDKFNQLEFHDRVLDEGAVPLPMLEKITESW